VTWEFPSCLPVGSHSQQPCTAGMAASQFLTSFFFVTCMLLPPLLYFVPMAALDSCIPFHYTGNLPRQTCAPALPVLL